MLRAAIYGLGRWGNTLVESVKDSEKFRFVKGISRNPENHKEFSQKTGIKVVSSYGRVLKDPEIDAIVLATPHSLHVKQIAQAAKAGKHVFVEKPMTLTRKTAEKAVEACRAAGITLGVGFNRRHAPAFVEMMRRIRAGEIGDVLHIEAAHSGATGYRLNADSWRSTREEAPAGGMTARGIHTLDSMIQIAGLVTSVYAFSDKRKHPPEITMDDTTSMLLKFASGATGYLSTIFVTGRALARARLRLQGLARVARRYRPDLSRARGRPEPHPARSRRARNRRSSKRLPMRVAAKQSFVVPAEEAINGVAVLEAIVASAAKGRPIQIK